MTRRLSITLFVSAVCLVSVWSQVSYRQDMYPLIVQDIYAELLEEGREVDLSDLEEDLEALREHPLNINSATQDQLRQLYFLSDEQIEKILLMVYRQPLDNIYELRLLDCLTDYEIRNLMPFVKVEPVVQDNKIYWREIWHYGKSEIDLRFDARNIENNLKDPFYGAVKYKFNYRNQVLFGLSMERDPQEPFYAPHKTYGADFYGGFLELRSVGRLKTLVVGDYHASFGEGLTINTGMLYGGKMAALTRDALPKEGLKSKKSTAEYGFLRGVGATVDLGKVDLTAFYSARKVDGHVDAGTFPSILTTGYHRTDHELEGKREVWQQVAGTNISLRLNGLKLGVSLTEHYLSASLEPKLNYYNYNYFRGQQQLSVGLNYYYRWRWLTLSGEVATSQNTRWGVGNITSLRLTPISNLSLILLYRYYSAHFDNLLANAIGATSRQNDENGLLLGLQTTRLRHIDLKFYLDLFSFAHPKYGIHTKSRGLDALLSMTYRPSESFSVEGRLRGREQTGTGKYSVRLSFNYKAGNVLLRSFAEGNITFDRQQTAASPSFGVIVAQSADYHFVNTPITLQARAELFYTQKYDNRFYLYENDVLYAFSIPMLYGQGTRWYINFRYKINDIVSVYLKAAETIYLKDWAKQQGYTSLTRTEIHSMLRVTF